MVLRALDLLHLTYAQVETLQQQSQLRYTWCRVVKPSACISSNTPASSNPWQGSTMQTQTTAYCSQLARKTKIPVLLRLLDGKWWHLPRKKDLLAKVDGRIWLVGCAIRLEALGQPPFEPMGRNTLRCFTPCQLAQDAFVGTPMALG